MKICRIFGSVPIEFKSLAVLPSEGDLVIAADGGYGTLCRFGISPDIVLGDFDSLDGGYPTNGFSGEPEVIRYPIEKDDTDAMLAVKVGLERGYKSFELYGCLGGERPDHSVATLQTLAFIAENGAQGRAYDGDVCVTVLKNSEAVLDDGLTGDLSVFAFGGECHGVTLENVKYTLNDASLTPFFPLGVSNSFIKGKSARIAVRDGALLVMWKRSENTVR